MNTGSPSSVDTDDDNENVNDDDELIKRKNGNVLKRIGMTTQVVNNSDFRTFFEKEKLTRANFIDWYRNLRIMLSIEDKLTYLEHLIPTAPVPAPG
ncbi:hypothetical protein Tco_0535071 [Tanacetum coccineum]